MTRVRTSRRVGAAAVALLLCVAACAHDGRALRDPAPGATAPTVATATTLSGGQGPAVGQQITSFSVSSPVIGAGDAIPKTYTCDGANISPPLTWDSVPDGTVELALTVTDPDAGGFVHWVVANIDPSVLGFAEGSVPSTAVQAKNGAGTVGWSGP